MVCAANKTASPSSNSSSSSLSLVFSLLSIVAYTTLQTRSRTAVITNSLSQAKTKLEVYKVEQGAYPTTGNFSAAGIPSSPNATYSYVSMDGSAYCLTATNSTITYGITNTTTPTEGGCGNTNWLGDITLTNMVVNGDFSGGDTGWGSASGSRSVANNEMTYTITSLSGSARIEQVADNTAPGHIYYVRGSILPKFHTANTSLRIGNNSSSFTLAPNQWNELSAVITASDNVRLRFYHPTTTASYNVGDTVKFRNILAIDLTTAFGAGNEPTKEQMDAILSQFPNSYFNGTVSAGG